MFCFVTSVRHPLNSSDYGRVLQLLRDTLSSVCAQEHADFRVVVVCNEVPSKPYEDPRVVFVPVDFPPPSTLNGPRTGLPAIRRDRGAKYAVGVSVARQLGADYVMFFDADDFVHRGLVAWCRSQDGAPGYFVQRGLIWKPGSGLYGHLDDFHKWCGTCNILSTRLLAVSRQVSPTSSLEQIEASLDPEFLHTILGAHPFVVDHFAARGEVFLPVPFRAAVYLRDSGENHSPIGIFPRPHVLTPNLVRAFNLPIDRGPVRLLATAVAEYPRAWYRWARYGRGQ